MARVHPEESAPKVLGKDSDWLGTSHHLVIPVRCFAHTVQVMHVHV